ncbi:alcohol dehydrogenase catalytic domain-containing protein [Conyzicola nivalis]|uniref:alcohol dehydrogenase n=1 Tax=Conyzicola nivalis TaxID=1477021 RepID=A0A916SKL3_9MICO|nr:zinc-binding dehydrogenase [Conyzicola nivalis]GGB04555.1 alcohol dehydrogenase [Conyzicola nivalis]
MTVETVAVPRRIPLEPAASAMVWVAPDRPHELAAFVGVELGGSELLVEVELATICGSDVHTAHGDRTAPAPLILGHEQVGRVIALGSGEPCAVDGSPIAVGDRVVWSIAASCGACDRCESGLTQKCRALRKYGHERIGNRWALSGGFATHTHLLAGTPIVRVPDSVPAEVLAPVSCGTATAWAALDAVARTVTLPGATVLVSGAGLIGLTATALATDRGARVVVADPDPARRSLALRFGAVASYDPAASEHDIAQSLEAAGAGGGFDAVVEASGSSAAVLGAFASATVGGAIVLVGSVSPTEPVPVDPERIVRHLLTVTGVHNYTAEHLRAAAEFMVQQWRSRPFRELVGATVALRDLDAGIGMAGSGGPVRVAVDPRR